MSRISDIRYSVRAHSDCPPWHGLGSPGAVVTHGVGALMLRPLGIYVKGRGVLNHYYCRQPRKGQTVLNFRMRYFQRRPRTAWNHIIFPSPDSPARASPVIFT